MPHVSNKPAWRVTLDGRDLAAAITPRLVSLSISKKRGEAADQLDIVLSDHDGQLALPKPDAVLAVHLGWEQGSDVAGGQLVDMGSFVVDEVEHGGPPDVVTIRARSAALAGPLTKRRDHAWHKTTLAGVLKDVARRNGLTAKVASALGGTAVTSLAQRGESDSALLERLGREHDAVATIKRGTLIFSAVGAGVTPSGAQLATIEITRLDGDRHRYNHARREEGEGVTAEWHDREGAERKTVTAGKAEGAKKLRKTYASEAAARTAAEAARARLAREPRKLGFDLALGRPEINPEQRARLAGFKPEIDAATWLIVEVAHRFDGQGGFVTALEMEAV